ncbi:MAG: P-type conjugative transfer protein TrbL [Gammaproteobacteria bacterium]|nr:P-type conjugative transfer protein TrbL [Gammaproteobacteria bacterium]
MALGAFIVVIPDGVFAAIQQDGIITNIMTDTEETLFNTAAGLKLKQKMINTFFLLASLEFGFTMIFEVLRGGTLDSLFTIVVQRLIFIGVMWWIFDHGLEYGNHIVKSMLGLGNEYHENLAASPARTIEWGMKVVKDGWDAIGFWDWGLAIGMVFLGAIVLLTAVFIGAMMAVAIVEFWFMVNMGVFLLGFGASSVTKDYAINYLKMCFVIGAKLFVILGINIIVQKYISEFMTELQVNDLQQWIVLAGVMVLFAMLMGQVPQLLAGMLMNGLGVNMPSGYGRAVQGAAAATGGALKSTGGTAAAAVQAGKLSSAQGGGIGGAMKNFASAAVSDIAGRQSGRINALKGTTMGARMAGAMRSQRNAIKSGKK